MSPRPETSLLAVTGALLLSYATICQGNLVDIGFPTQVTSTENSASITKLLINQEKYQPTSFWLPAWSRSSVQSPHRNGFHLIFPQSYVCLFFPPNVWLFWVHLVLAWLLIHLLHPSQMLEIQMQLLAHCNASLNCSHYHTCYRDGYSIHCWIGLTFHTGCNLSLASFHRRVLPFHCLNQSVDHNDCRASPKQGQ